MGVHTETAQILAFPKRFRPVEKFERQAADVLDLSTRRLPIAGIGDCWYHDEAIRQDRGDAR